MRSHRRRPRLNLRLNPSLKLTSSPNTRNRTRPSTPLRSNLMRSNRNTHRSPILISSQAARKRRYTPNLIKASRQRPLQRSAPKISSSF